MFFIKILSNVGYCLIGVLVLFFLILLLTSLGKLKSSQTKNAIAQKLMLNINGAKQGMFIVGDNMDNPILLFLHGGPGSPEYIAFYKDLKELEKEYTVCYWDQRGSGMSYHFNLPKPTVENLVEDTRVVTEYLINRFSKTKIFLLGHSWGTYLGVKVIEKYPELFAAYIGIGQISNQLQSERLAYSFFMDQCRQEHNTTMLKKLGQYNTKGEDFALDITYIRKVRNILLNRYGVGATHIKMDSKKMLKNIFFFKGYTAFEKIKIPFGILKSLRPLFTPVIQDNLMESSLKFEIPVFIIQGAFDYQVSYTLAKEYFELIEAPTKEFFTFDVSAHCPLVEEQDRFITVMKDIQERVNRIR